MDCLQVSEQKEFMQISAILVIKKKIKGRKGWFI